MGGRAVSYIKFHITWHGSLLTLHEIPFFFFCFLHCTTDMSLTLCQISYCCLPNCSFTL